MQFRVLSPKTCHAGLRSILNWRSFFKTRHKKILHPPPAKKAGASEVTAKDTLDAHQPRGGVGRMCNDSCLKNPHFSWVSPSMFLPSATPQDPKSLSSVLSLFYRFIALLLRSNILPNSNHPLQLPITRDIRAGYMCNAHINKFAYLLLSCVLSGPEQWNRHGQRKKDNFFPPL